MDKNIIIAYQKTKLKNFAIPENIKIENIFIKNYSLAIEYAKNKNADFIAFIYENQEPDYNWLINNINKYKNESDKVILQSVEYNKFKNNYPDFITENRIFRIILKDYLNKQKKSNKNFFIPLALNNEGNFENYKIIKNKNSVIFNIVDNIPILKLLFLYLKFLLKLNNTPKKRLQKWYKKKTGKTLDIDNPKTYNEKIQWLKLYDSTTLKSELADKYKVREWVKEKIGEEYLIPLLGVWDSFDDIDFDKLPNKFVLKCNHGCGFNLIVKDKSKLDIKKAKKKVNKWLSKDYGYKGCELHYLKIPKKIIAEEYIENTKGDLFDYKIWYFNGKAHYIQFLSERNTKGLKMAFYDRDWQKQNFVYSHPLDKKNIEKPKNLDLLLSLAEKLAKGFNHVRVDFYITNDGKIYFGEMTFTSCSGICKWKPQNTDFYFGNLFELPIKQPKIIVSLTSFPARISTTYLTINSLLNQTLMPNKIILNLSEEEFLNKEKDLPENLLNLQKQGLTINWCKNNVRSYKKLIPTLNSYPNDIIITVDDDFVYDKNLIKFLYNSYKNDPKCIHCHRISKILLNNDGTLKAKAKNFYNFPSFANKLVGCGGVLYPPNSLYKDANNENLFMKLAPTNDDIWFWLMSVLNNTKIKLIKNHISSPKEIKSTKNGPCLCKINDKGEKLFYKDLNNVLNHYKGLKEKIISDII